MSITDELRKWVHDAEDYGVIFTDEDAPTSDIPVLLGIADRIDAEHRAALEKVAAMVDEPDEKRSAYYDRFIAPMVEYDDGWSGCRSCKAHKRGGVVECQAYANMLRCDRLENRVSAIERKLEAR